MPVLDAPRTDVRAPAGYAPLRVPAGTGLCRADCAEALGTALGTSTLFAWAAARPERRTLHGRGVAYAVTMPGVGDLVMRHSRHGGLLAPLTRDLFLPPTRAPLELAASLRLRAAGVPTPELVAWLTYDAGPLFRRADVATRLVTGGRDLADVLCAPARDEGPTAPWLVATGALLAALARAGARHPDLNIKNVLLAHDGATRQRPTAYVLDVDVVQFRAAATVRDVAAANWARFARSLRKWQTRHALHVRADEIDALRAAALVDR